MTKTFKTKRSTSQKLLAIILSFAFVFAATGLGGCNNNPNSGRIRGLDGGEFTAHFFDFYSTNFLPWDWDFGYTDGIPTHINSKQELQKFRNSLNLQINHLLEFNHFFEKITQNYSEHFFEANQLVFITNLYTSLRLPYKPSTGYFEINSVRYSNGNLNINLTRVRPRTTGLFYTAVGSTPHFVIVETTNLPHNTTINTTVNTISRRIRN